MCGGGILAVLMQHRVSPDKRRNGARDEDLSHGSNSSHSLSLCAKAFQAIQAAAAAEQLRHKAHLSQTFPSKWPPSQRFMSEGWQGTRRRSVIISGMLLTNDLGRESSSLKLYL